MAALPSQSHSLSRNRDHAYQIGSVFFFFFVCVNGALCKYGIIAVVTQNDERGASSEMQSEGVSVPKRTQPV